MNRPIILFTAVCAILLPAPADAQSIGTVTYHNGSTESDPAGTGDVPVSLHYYLSAFGPYKAVFSGVATHEVHYSYAPNPVGTLFSRSLITNATPSAWSGFEILLEGADFAGWDPSHPDQARTGEPAVLFGRIGDDCSAVPWDQIAFAHQGSYAPLSLAGSSITRFNDQGSGFRDAHLIVTFGEPLQPNISIGLVYNIIPSPALPDAAEFTAFFTPIPVPEPASLILLGLGTLSFAIRCRASRGSWWLENRRT